MSTVQDKINITLFEGSNFSKEIEIPSHLRVVDEKTPIDGSLSVIYVPTPKDGDKRIVWDNNNMEEILDAKELFNKLIEEGMVPYVCDPSGKKTPQIMREFDPMAEEVVMADDHRRPKKEIVMSPQKALVGG